jgi:PAS domain S-box-containing protein
VLGYSIEELLQHRFLDFVHPDDLQPTLDAMSKLESQELVLNFVNRYRCRDGSYRYIEWRSHPAGSIIYAAARDITAHRLTNEELANQIVFQQALIESIPHPVFTKDAQGRFLGCNKAYEKAFGTTISYMRGRTVLDLEYLADDERQKFHSEDLRIINEAGHAAYEMPIVFADGLTHITLYSVDGFRLADGKPGGLIGMLVDITGQKKAEGELVTGRQRLDDIITGTNAGTWEWNVQTGETVFNERWADIVGYTLEELSPTSIETWNRLLHPDDRDECTRLLQQHFNREIDYYQFEGRMLHKDGSLIWVLDRGKVVKWTGDGKPLLMSGTHQDITAQKHIEENLRESENNFRSFFETISDMIFIADYQGHILFTNSSVTNILGYSAEQLRTMHILDVHPAGHRDEAEAIYADMFAGLRTSCPLPLATAEGTTIPVETRVWFGKWNGQDCIFGISKDITKEQLALQKFNKLFDNNPALMAVSTRPDGRLTEVNQAFVNRTGYAPHECRGRTLEELGLAPDGDSRRIMREELAARGRVSNRIIKINTRSGDTISGLFSAEIIDSQGEQLLLMVLSDITEQLLAEEKLRHSEEQLRLTLNATGEGIWDWNITANTVHHNLRWCELLGLDDTSLTHELEFFANCIHPADREQVFARVNTAMSADTHYESEHRMLRPDGSVIWVHDRGAVVERNTDGTPARMLGSIADITDRKNAEDELQYYSRIQEILLSISRTYINFDPGQINTIINNSLRELGELVHADRAYVFSYDFETQTTSNTHEWCSEGTEPEIDSLQNIPLDNIPFWVEKHRRNEAYFIPDVSQLPDEGEYSVKRILQAQGVKSIITLPLFSDGVLSGFAGFDSVKTLHSIQKNKPRCLPFRPDAGQCRKQNPDGAHAYRAKEQAEAQAGPSRSFCQHEPRKQNAAERRNRLTDLLCRHR